MKREADAAGLNHLLQPRAGAIAFGLCERGGAMPVGTSYAVWVGVVAVGTAILGIVLLGEPANTGRLVSLGPIVAGIVGLKLSSPV